MIRLTLPATQAAALAHGEAVRMRRAMEPQPMWISSPRPISPNPVGATAFVAETYRAFDDGNCCYAADFPEITAPFAERIWLPAAAMPESLARTFARCVNVTVELRDGVWEWVEMWEAIEKP